MARLICHGPWMLCSTDALKGRRCTSYMSIVHDVVNAGGQWVDEECVVDGPIITARTPRRPAGVQQRDPPARRRGKAEAPKGKDDRPGLADGDVPRRPRVSRD
jgi:hypothetical protein